MYNLFKREVRNKFSVNMCPNNYCAYLVYSRAEKKQHDSDEEKEKTQKKTTFENDSDDTIPESVSKLNKIVFYDDTDSDSWKFVV